MNLCWEMGCQYSRCRRKKCIQKHTEKQEMLGLFFADHSDLVYPVGLLNVLKSIRIYMIWCACILYFQNAFDKVPCQKS